MQTNRGFIATSLTLSVLLFATTGCGPSDSASESTVEGKSVKGQAVDDTIVPATGHVTADPTSSVTATAVKPESSSRDSASNDTSRPVPVRLSQSQQASSLDNELAELQIPPQWLASVKSSWDMAKPWQEGRVEIRRLLGLNDKAASREAIKLTWEYRQKSDIGNGHEYGMYLFMGREPAWAVAAYREWLPQQKDYLAVFGYRALASLYFTEFDEFELAEDTLNTLMAKAPDNEFPIMRQAEAHDSFGDLYVAWGKIDEAKQHYAESVRLYPLSQPKYGRHLLPRRAKQVQSKLDALSFGSFANLPLKDGVYKQSTLGYSGDIELTLSVTNGRLDDITIQHQEKIDQNACVLVPRQIVDEQTLRVDAVTGASITRDAIVVGAYRALRQAGLQ